MKKSNRYATRFTAKKRAVAKKIGILELDLRTAKGEIARLRQQWERSAERGVVTIQIGRTTPGFRGDCLSLRLDVSVRDFFYQMRMGAGGDFQNVNATVRHHCRDVCCKMEAAMMEFLQKEKMV